MRIGRREFFRRSAATAAVAVMAPAVVAEALAQPDETYTLDFANPLFPPATGGTFAEVYAAQHDDFRGMYGFSGD